MAFENAIITKEDDEKYGLSEIFYQFNPTYKTLPDGKSWVVDKNADCWFMETKFFQDPEYDHAYLKKSVWTLYCKGEIIEATLDYQNNISDTEKFHRIWKLLELKPKETKSLSKNQILMLLNKILNVYGYDGAWGQIENFTMELQDLVDGGEK